MESESFNEQTYSWASLKVFKAWVITARLSTAAGKDKDGTADPGEGWSPPVAALTVADICLLEGLYGMGVAAKTQKAM